MKRILSYAACAVISATMLSACGGGGSNTTSNADTVTLKIAGQSVGEVTTGQSGSATLHAGQSIEIGANTSVTWTLTAGGSTINGYGNTLNLGNASVQETTTSASGAAWTANTSESAPLANPVSFAVTAATNPATTFTFTLTN